MNFQKTMAVQAFHGLKDSGMLQPTYHVETTTTKYLVTTIEREVSYRFYLHQHPYVKDLTRRLLEGGTRKLQDADTLYAASKAALPDSIEISLVPGAAVKLPADAPIALLALVHGDAGGTPIDLDASMDLHLGADADATAPDGLRANLAAGLTPAPEPGDFVLPADSKATSLAIATITLTNATAIALYDGSSATVPAGTQVQLAAGTPLTIPNTPKVTVVKSRPVPEFYSDFFESFYDPDPMQVMRPYPVRNLDFTYNGAYSAYNWELFFHVPFTIASYLSKNGMGREAQQWFHYIFKPNDDSTGPTPQRFWKFEPFRYIDVKKIEDILVNLVTGVDKDLRDETILSIDAWRDAPFRPHVVARYRQQAYMYKTVMAYVDNLISWGDSLFRQDTGEAVDEAMMLYVLAADILGPRPQPVPKKGTVRPLNYENLRNDLKQFGTAMADVEADLPFDLMPLPSDRPTDTAGVATLRSLGKALYFSVPRNDKLMSYWDTVADRLFKIRNSLNIEGVFRQLALFEPPIDPALLARAAASGLDVGAIVNGLNQPLPLVRFPLWVQKAAEVAQEVKALGGNLLSAMEKEDGEAMAILRARHERTVMELVEQVKYSQLQDAIKSREGLLRTLDLSIQRYKYYERQLGKKAEEITIPELAELDKDSLSKLKLSIDEPRIEPREIEVDIAQDLGVSGGRIISSYEQTEMNLTEAANGLQTAAGVLDLAAAPLSLIPQFQVRVTPWGLGAGGTFGGEQLSKISGYLASMSRTVAGALSGSAGMSSKIGSFARREQDWAFQSNLAAGEISQVFKQLRGAQIREAIAELELKNHRQQMKNAEEIDRFLNEEGTEKNGKKTNKALYSWMKREVRGLYAQCFQFAFDIAKKAERALQHELGDPGLTYLQYGYLAGKEGLLAGERLFQDVKRMEMAYHDLNHREYEMTKHVSLLQVDPMALIDLRVTGAATVRLPEALFDMDGPGHYFRRIKAVGVSVPCVTGPYVGIHCTLTLLKGTIRKTSAFDAGAYDRIDANDDRFDDHLGSLQSIVTSTGQNDSGMFETNLRDERYLPFENSGVIGEWHLQLPANPSKNEPAQFDYNTITDVILHLRYTAREGGKPLRDAAVKSFMDQVADAEAPGCVRLFSVRHEFSTAWEAFKGQTPAAGQRYVLELKIQPEHYPFWSRGRLAGVKRVDIVARGAAGGNITVFKNPAQNDATPLADLQNVGGLARGAFKDADLPAKPDSKLLLYFDSNAISECWIAVTWNS